MLSTRNTAKKAAGKQNSIKMQAVINMQTQAPHDLLQQVSQRQ